MGLLNLLRPPSKVRAQAPSLTPEPALVSQAVKPQGSGGLSYYANTSYIKLRIDRFRDRRWVSPRFEPGPEWNNPGTESGALVPRRLVTSDDRLGRQSERRLYQPAQYQVGNDPGVLATDRAGQRLGVAAGPDDPGLVALLERLTSKDLSHGADSPPEDPGMQ